MDSTCTRSCCWHWRGHQATQGTVRLSPKLWTACYLKTQEFLSVNVCTFWFSLLYRGACSLAAGVSASSGTEFYFLVSREEKLDSCSATSFCPPFVSHCLQQKTTSPKTDTHETKPSQSSCLTLLSQKLMLWSWHPNNQAHHSYWHLFQSKVLSFNYTVLLCFCADTTPEIPPAPGPSSSRRLLPGTLGTSLLGYSVPLLACISTF